MARVCVCVCVAAGHFGKINAADKHSSGIGQPGIGVLTAVASQQGEGIDCPGTHPITLRTRDIGSTNMKTRCVN